jgi:hypothetical protein
MDDISCQIAGLVDAIIVETVEARSLTSSIRKQAILGIGDLSLKAML